MNVCYRVELSQAKRGALTALLSGGKQAACKFKRAQILLAADAGASDEEIATSVGLPTGPLGYDDDDEEPAHAIRSRGANLEECPITGGCGCNGGTRARCGAGDAVGSVTTTTVLVLRRESTMRKTPWFVIAMTAALMLGIGAWAGWAGSMHRGHVMGPSTGLNIDAIQATIDGKSLPIQHYDDFSLVF